MAREFKFIKAATHSFKGIKESFIVDMTAMNKTNKPITKLAGNQGKGKTSFVESIIYAFMGTVPGVDFARLINKDTGTINLDHDFQFENDLYRVHATKTKFELLRYLGERTRKGKVVEEWHEEPEPKTTLREMIGPLGLDPKKLADMDGAKQIDTFRKTYANTNLSEQIEEKEAKLRGALKNITDKRKEARREYTRLKKALELNQYWVERERWDSQFKDKKISKDEAEKAFNEAQENFNQYNKYKAALPTYDGRIETEDAEILRLEEQLRAAKERKQKLIDGKAACEKWLEDNNAHPINYAAAKENYMNVSEMLVKQNDYRLMVTQEEEMHEYESLVAQANGTVDDLTEQLRELTKQILPDIPGLEIRIATGFDESEDEGIYYQGRNIGTLSESELWQLFFLIWQDLGVNMVFVENISSLGSEAVAILNNIAASGANVFATEMDRKKDSIKVTFVDEIK